MQYSIDAIDLTRNSLCTHGRSHSTLSVKAINRAFAKMKEQQGFKKDVDNVFNRLASIMQKAS